MATPSLAVWPRRTLSPRPVAAAMDMCVFCSQRRQISKARRAPATRRKHRDQEPYAMSPEAKARIEDEQKRLDFLKKKLPSHMSVAEKMTYTRVAPAVAEMMTRNQALFLGMYRFEGEDKAFDSGLDYSSASQDEVYDLAVLLRNRGSEFDAHTGRQLGSQLYDRGHAETTVQVAWWMLRRDMVQRGTLRQRGATIAQSRLREISDRGNARALMLEARLTERRGNPEKALELFERATEQLIINQSSSSQDKYARIPDELSAPWIDLAYAHLRQGNTTKALRAYMIGLDQDDPLAYHNLANLEYHKAGGYTEDWLYNMTKAAASGYFRSADALGRYYAEAAPPPAAPVASLSERLQGFLAFLFKPTISRDPKQSIREHAAFAQDPVTRIQMAVQWLTTARDAAFTHASIPLAQIRLQKYIYPTNNLTRPLDPFGLEKAEGAIRNPLFNPCAAHSELALIMVACRRIPEARRVSKDTAAFRFNTHPWSRDAEVLETLEPKLAEMEAVAKEIADAAGIDIRAHSEVDQSKGYGVMYRHQGNRGEGLFEMMDGKKS